MPRTYKRLTNRKSWSTDVLKRALNAIEEGSSIRKAGRDFGIPEATLRDKLKNLQVSNTNLGRNATFTDQQEQELVRHVIRLAKLFLWYDTFDT